MTFRVPAAVAGSLVLAGIACAVAEGAAPAVEPRPGVQLSGTIQFPRPQAMWMETDRRDGTRVTVGMGFDGRCRGGGLKEVWASRIPARQTVRVRGGEFSANLTGVARNLGEVRGRTGEFSWRLVGRFVEDAVVTATVTGTAEVKRQRPRDLPLQDRRAGLRPARDPQPLSRGRGLAAPT